MRSVAIRVGSTSSRNIPSYPCSLKRHQFRKSREESMGTNTVVQQPLIQIVPIEETIRQRVAEERARLEREAGLKPHRTEHFHRPIERPFTAAEREKTTLLFGGLTWKHEKLIRGALEGLGYNCEVIPTADVNAFQLGKEYGNNGQCNPTYFTVGNLVQYLQKMEEAGSKR